MANINNPNYLSKMYNAALSTTANAEDQIEDGIDSPHTGIIKALGLIGRGNHVVRRTNGFNIVTSNATQFTITAGKFYRDGKLQTATGAGTFTLTHGGGATFPSLSSTEGIYFLVVVKANNALAVRSSNPAAVNKVPTHQTGDVIVAVLGYTGNASNGSQLLVQFLTTDKTTNSVSIGYELNNQYEEAASLTGTNQGLYISGIGATGTAAVDDKVIIQDTSASNVIKTVTAAAIAALAPTGSVTSVSAGTGMTQTGTSTVNPTLNVIGGAGITASSNEILITDAGVTMAKLANIATDTFIGRTAANTGVPKALSKAEALAILNVADGANNYTHPDHSGDVTSNSDGATTIVADAVTYAKMQNLGTANRVLGSTSTGLIGEVQIVVDMMTANSVDSAQYVDGSIDHEHLSGDCIDGDNIQDSVINSEHYANGSIDNIHLAPAIDSVKIANGSVTNTEFQYLNGATSTIQTQLNLKIKQGLHSIWIPAEAMTPRINAGCGALTATAAGNTNNPDFRSLPFDKSTQEHCQFSIAMPKMWDEQAVFPVFYWTSASTSTNTGCLWAIRGVSISDNIVINKAFGNPAAGFQLNSGNKNLSILSLDQQLTIAEVPNAGDICFFEVQRIAADNGDTLDADALLLGVKLLYTINAENDA
tara:strand:- start:3461 stop:5410 length:1950 start_codon:yes stop_codon:yes gene_type:complete